MAVSPELHDAVLERDKLCFVRRLYGPAHICRDRWGDSHPPTDLRKLTLDHVHLVAGGMRGKRAPDDLQHLVAMCAQVNVSGPSREIRDAERTYLANLYPGDSK